MCGPTAPTALRRRSFRSSDRGRDFVFGSSLGRPGEHDDCLALSRRSSLLEIAGVTSRKGPPSGGASGSPITIALRGGGDGFDAASFAGAREWRADAHASGRACPRRAVSPSCTRATAEGRREGARTTGRRSSEQRWVANESLRRCVAMTSETACLRVYGPTRWISSRGRFTGIPFVARRGCGRGDSFGRFAGATAIEHGRPFGDNRTLVAGSQTGPKHPAFPSRSGEGTPKRFGPPGGMSSESWAARYARQRRKNESIQSPREHRASRDGNVARTQRTPRWKKALRSRAVQRAVVTRKRARLQRREGTPAGERDRVRKDEAR
jgi:hypothetical protein